MTVSKGLIRIIDKRLIRIINKRLIRIIDKELIRGLMTVNRSLVLVADYSRAISTNNSSDARSVSILLTSTALWFKHGFRLIFFKLAFEEKIFFCKYDKKNMKGWNSKPEIFHEDKTHETQKKVKVGLRVAMAFVKGLRHCALQCIGGILLG